MIVNRIGILGRKSSKPINALLLFYGLLVTITYSFLERCYRYGGFFSLSAAIFLAACICLVLAVFFIKKKNQSFTFVDYVRAISFSLSQILLLNGIFVSGISVSFGASVAGVIFAIIFSKWILKEKILAVDALTFFLSVLGCALLGSSLHFPLLAFLSGVLQGVTLVLTKKVMKANSHSVHSVSLSLFTFAFALAINGIALKESFSLNSFATLLLPALGLLSMFTQVSYFLMCERFSSAYVGSITLTRVPWAILFQGGVSSHILGFFVFLIIIPARYIFERFNLDKLQKSAGFKSDHSCQNLSKIKKSA